VVATQRFPRRGEGGVWLLGDEEVEHPGAAGGRQQRRQRGQDVPAELFGGELDEAICRRQGHRQILAFAKPGRGGAVEHPLHRGTHSGDERLGEHVAVKDDVHVDNRRAAELLRPAGRHRDAARRGQGFRDRCRCGQHHLVRQQGRPTGPADHPALALAVHVEHLGAGVHVHTGRAQAGQRRITVQPLQRYQRPADVTRGGVGEQSLLHHHGGERQGSIRGPGIEGGDADEVPQRRGDRCVLAVLAQPGAEALGVGGPVVGVDVAQGQRTPHCPEPVGRRQHRVAGQGTGEVQRCREAVAPQPRRGAVGGTNRDVQAGLQHHLATHLQPVQKLQVGGATAKEHVLAVVDLQLAAGEGVGEPAQPRASLEQRHPVAGVRAAQGGGDAGQATADHRDVGAHPALPASDRAATPAFSQPDSERRWWYTAVGSAAICACSRR